MMLDRPYRKAMPPEAAAAELRRCAGTHFDVDVVEALLKPACSPTRASARSPRSRRSRHGGVRLALTT